MQMAVIEYSRNVLGLVSANSTEMNSNTLYPVIDLMEEQKNITNYGGTMRLGAWDCLLKDGSKVRNIYHKEHISERHRHRYELNNDFLEQIEKAGMIATGKTLKPIWLKLLKSQITLGLLVFNTIRNIKVRF
jgi:CTP synthase